MPLSQRRILHSSMYSPKTATSYFALSLSPAVPRPAVKPRDVVILFDTSASQSGAYREKALVALESTLAALAPADRVRLYAVDLNAIPLMEKFSAANGPETRQALSGAAWADAAGRHRHGRRLGSHGRLLRHGARTPPAVMRRCTSATA